MPNLSGEKRRFAKESNKKARAYDQKEPKKCFFVFTEGEKTEPNYFAHLNQRII